MNQINFYEWAIKNGYGKVEVSQEIMDIIKAFEKYANEILINQIT